MGTAIQSVRGDPGEKAALEELLELIGKQSFDKRKKVGVEVLIAEVVNKAIFGDAADEETRNRVTTVVQGEVMDKIITKYKKWRDQDNSDPSKWPFPKVS
jgi:hypothetical protein